MNPLLLLAVAAAGGLGAAARYLVDVGVGRRVGGAFPWGILVVNVSGSLLLGALTGLALHAAWLWMLGAGLLGGYTTFSTVAVETWLLAEAGARRATWGNALGSLLACVTAAGAGVLLGAWIAGALA
ncbi:MAG: CrcB family protein [Microbacteriaceae bacterium]|nr:CrcB family protein [Microbacteriaceae bacterium]